NFTNKTVKIVYITEEEIIISVIDTRYAVDVWTTKEHEMSEHRETANADMDQAIPRLAGDIASGRAEDSMLFHKTFALCANVL
ncbi:MAG: hypothetical protein ACLFVO_07405, partial [Chloroflexaceae bacterium]